MLTRALIVLLVLLNVSVALWWLLRGEPVIPDVLPPSGVAELQLLDPAAPVTAPLPSAPTAPLQDTTVAAVPPAAPAPVPASPPTPAGAATPAPETPPPSAPARCIALGPFPDRSAALEAQVKAGSGLLRSRLDEQPIAGASTRFRVMMPPADSREAAQATVQRIVAAGISDYYVIGQGPDANAIALGQYRNREGAERRLAVLRAAGFQAQLSGGEGASHWWVQGALADGKADPGLRQRSGAGQQRSLDCAGLR